MALRTLLRRLYEATGTFDPKSMAPDTRDHHLDRAAQIERIRVFLDVAKKPPDEDAETNLANGEAAFDMVYYCTHNDVVARAVAAAKKIGGKVADYMISGAEEREKLNKKRTANTKKYGVPK